MPTKNITLADNAAIQDKILGANQNLDIVDKAGLKGHVIFKSIDTGEVLYDYWNKVIIAGSQRIAEKAFGLAEKVHLETYNEAIHFDNDEPTGTAPGNTPVCCLFCCGINGCGSLNSQVKTVSYTKRIQPPKAGRDTDLIPFRYPVAAADTVDRTKYFGKKSSTTYNAYYFKGFEAAPTLHLQYKDGTVITTDTNIYEASDTRDAETYVEMSLRVTAEDFREYFQVIESSLDNARINSIGLCFAWYKTIDNVKYYQDIIPFTQLNIPNEALIDTTKGIDITYHVYF